MATLVWDQIEERRFETGVSKGVLYKEDGFGVAWNGLTAVDESSVNEIEPVFFDGVKINDIVTLGDFAGVIHALTYPDDFLPFEGIIEEQPGFYITGQTPRRFGMSYRTEVGSVDASWYKIHLLYNLTAIPADKSFATLALDNEPTEFQWNVTSIPDELDYYHPTGHVIIDSRHIDSNLLVDIEAILYGDSENEARLPSLKALTSFLRKWERLIITDHGDGTWTAESPLDDIITMLDSETFQIVSDTAVYLDADTYTIESSDKNEEDV